MKLAWMANWQDHEDTVRGIKFPGQFRNLASTLAADPKKRGVTIGI